MDVIESFWVLPGFTYLKQFLLRFYLILLGFTGFYLVVEWFVIFFLVSLCVLEQTSNLRKRLSFEQLSDDLCDLTGAAADDDCALSVSQSWLRQCRYSFKTR